MSLSRSLYGLKTGLTGFWRKLLRDPQQVDLLRQMTVDQRRQNFAQRPLVQLHLHNLAHPQDMTPGKLSVGYSMERLARQLQPRVLVDFGLSRPALGLMCIGKEWTEAVATGTRTKIEYCRRHGYNLILLDARPRSFTRHIIWLKVPFVFRLLQLGYPSIFHLDADTLVTNPAIPLEPFIERLEKNGRHLLVAEDLTELNFGIFFLRHTWQSLTLLDLLHESDADLEHRLLEQQALIELMEHQPLVRQLVDVETDARRFNSMVLDHLPTSEAERAAYVWQPGDFLCHFAGIHGVEKIRGWMEEIDGKKSSPPATEKAQILSKRDI